MKKILFSAVFLILLVASAHAQRGGAAGRAGQQAVTASAAADTVAQMTKPQMQEMYIRHLRREGYMPEIDSDGDILFKAEGGTDFIIVNEDDQTYFRIIYPNFWSIDDDDELKKVSSVASLVTQTVKLVSVYLTRDQENTAMEAETLLNRPQDFSLHFERLMRVLLHAKTIFVNEMRK